MKSIRRIAPPRSSLIPSPKRSPVAEPNACRAKVCGGFAKTTCTNKELKCGSESERSRRALEHLFADGRSA
ncbi:hypothetical protein C9E91_15480 [Rhizobium sp. SEMIA4064]|nr:hypothetical protein C9E91_15480 [Rhizobium sp. SEMIA4064]